MVTQMQKLVVLLCLLLSCTFCEVKQREQQLSDHYWIVGDHVEYWESQQGKNNKVKLIKQVLRKSDPITFQPLVVENSQISYGVSNHHVYMKEEIIKHADPRTFRPLNGGYAIDRTHVYYLGKRIKGADPQTFTLLRSVASCQISGLQIDARDANNLFLQGQPVNAPETIDQETYTALDQHGQ